MSGLRQPDERPSRGASPRAAACAAIAALGCSVLQLSLIDALFPAGPLAVATPLLPVVLVAAWGAARDPVETVPAAIIAAVVLGTVSSERVGWFLIALLPTIVAVITVRTGLDWVPAGAGAPGIDAAGDVGPSFPAAALLGAGAAAAGSASYVALLTIAGEPSLFPDLLGSIVGTMLWSAGLAAALAPLLRPLRRERRGLFV